MERPFQFLKEHIDEIMCDCDPQYIPDYKRAFSAVLDRMDKFFYESGLYDAVDYEPIVRGMLGHYGPKSFSLTINEEYFQKHPGHAGITLPRPDGTSSIAIPSKNLYRGVITEGILCHEFIHYLTLGVPFLSYEENGVKYTNSISGDKYKTNCTTFAREKFEFPLKLGFICEGLTEWLTEFIYPENRDWCSYGAQVSMMNYINNVTGARLNTRDFLRADLSHYIKSINPTLVNSIEKHCANFQEKFSNGNLPMGYKCDKDYLAAQKIICCGALDKLIKNPQNYSIEELIRIASTAKTDIPVPCFEIDSTHKTVISKVVENFTESLLKGKEDAEQEGFRQVLKLAIEKTIQHKTDMFNLPYPHQDFAIKKTGVGFALCVDGQEITDYNMPTNPTKDKMNYRRSYSHDNWKTVKKVNLTWDGEGWVVLWNTGAKQQTIKIVQEGKGNLTIKDKNNAFVCKMNPKEEAERAKPEIESCITLLNNYNQINNIENILNDNDQAHIRSIKKVTTSKGVEYLMVGNGTHSTKIYSLIDGKLQLVPTFMPSKKLTEQDICIDNGSIEKPKRLILAKSAKGSKSSKESIKLICSYPETFLIYVDENGVEKVACGGSGAFNKSTSQFESGEIELIYQGTDSKGMEMRVWPHLFKNKKQQVEDEEEILHDM